MISYKTPAKVILSGEHGVVYGKPALITALARYATVRIEEAKDTLVPHEAVRSVEEAVKNYCSKHAINFEDRPYKLNYDIDIPLGMGLGSSAALSVGVSAALLEFYTGKEPAKDVINTIAYQGEKQFHGNPSGADNSTCCYGGLIFFRKEFEFLKTISALNSKLPKDIEDHLYLINTGQPLESTKEMVKMVGKRYNENPVEMDHLLSALEKVTRRMVVSVVTEDAALFRSCMEENGHILETMHVVSPDAQQMLLSLKECGVGKITGAGGLEQGSGFALFYADDPELFETVATKKKVDWSKFHQDHTGVVRV